MDKRVFASNILDTDAFEKAKGLNIDTIVCNEKRIDIPKGSGIEVINSEIYRIPGTWEAYHNNTRVINALSQKVRLIINGQDIKKALAKYIYWTNHRIGYLYACIKDRSLEGNIIYAPRYLPANKLKEVLKYYKNLLANNLNWIFGGKQRNDQKFSGKKIGLLINDEFELGIFEYLVKLIPPEDLVIFHYGNIDFGKIPFAGHTIEKCNVGIIKRFSKQPVINPLSLKVEELAIVNIISGQWQDISSEIERFRYIAQSSVKSLVINVGENLPLRNLMTDMFQGEIKVYNTMNGMKSGEAHDGDVYFDTWFVWDEKMKNMLVDQCGIDRNTLSISGHLMRDFVQDYRFGNALGITAEELKDRKVVSLFSVRGNREEKLQALKFIYELAEKDASYYFLIRPHPLEKSGDFDFRNSSNDNIRYVSYGLDNSKQSLYDQIHLTDVAIVFGSTVAIECQWMGVPCITFEMRNISNVYSVDNESIKHVKSIENLVELIVNMKKKPNFDKTEKNISVAANILEKINKD